MALRLPPLQPVVCTRGASPDGLATRSGLRSRDGLRTRVLSGLRVLQGKGTGHHAGTKEPCSPRGILLHPITAASRRANELVASADAGVDVGGEITKVTRPANRRRLDRQFTIDEIINGSDGVAGATAMFESLVSQIEEQLSGGDSSIRVVRKGERISESVPVRGLRRYKVPLPNRPIEVKVSLNKVSGRAPSLFASTFDPQPCSSKYEFRGKDEKLVYKHVLPPAEEESGVDRRHVAPPCRELFVTVEALLGECQYELLVTCGPPNVTLSRKEMTAQVAKIHRSWEARIHDLQHDILAREEFDSHVTDLRKAAVQHKRTAARGHNFVRRNIGNAHDCSARSKVVGLHKRALQNCARHDACSLRRADRQTQQNGSTACNTPSVTTEVELFSACTE